MATATYVPIATQTLGSATSTITFSSIPSGYTDLRVVLGNIQAASGCLTYGRINGDSGSNYSYTSLYGQSAAANATNAINQTYLNLVSAVGPLSSNPSFMSLDIFSYTSSTYKTMLVNWAEDYNSGGVVENNVQLWRNTSAITSLSFFNSSSVNFLAGTTATLWGI